jgi:hydrogenase small subunit
MFPVADLIPQAETLGDRLARQGVSRRAFLKYTAWLGSLMALPPSVSRTMAAGLARAPRQSVIWLSFQECTGCTESFTRSAGPTLEDLIFDFISLDYHHTLQAASGDAIEEARHAAMVANKGKYVVIVDGSIPLKDNGVYSTTAGHSNLDTLVETAKDAAAIIAVGTCATYGGIPKAKPNPTGAVSVADIIKDKPVINIPGCPPIPEAMSGVIAHLVAFGKPPALDHLGRPLAFFGENIHDRCYRRPFYERGQFAKSFDDEGARAGWCLYEVGCKGPTTYNACATVKWNAGTSFPIQSGHGCLGCSEPDFWDKGSFYAPLSAPIGPSVAMVGGAAFAGALAGAAAVAVARQRKANLTKE